MKLLRGLGIFILIVLAFGIISSAFFGKSSEPIENKPEDKEISKEKKEKKGTGTFLSWNYIDEVDKMERGTIKYATVISSNSVNFKFPYHGEQRAQLLLRIHPRYGKDVILEIDKGQFICHVYNCDVIVRFGNGAPQKFTAVAPTDHSTTTIFIKGYDRFLAAARKSNRVYIETTFYHEGNRIFEFDTTDLKW